jgi:isopentenyl-diphosphate delta-isomerase
MQIPLWISSMTGGAEMAGKINLLLAEACKTYGLGS